MKVRWIDLVYEMIIAAGNCVEKSHYSPNVNLRLVGNQHYIGVQRSTTIEEVMLKKKAGDRESKVGSTSEKNTTGKSIHGR